MIVAEKVQECDPSFLRINSGMLRQALLLVTKKYNSVLREGANLIIMVEFKAFAGFRFYEKNKILL